MVCVFKIWLFLKFSGGPRFLKKSSISFFSHQRGWPCRTFTVYFWYEMNLFSLVTTIQHFKDFKFRNIEGIFKKLLPRCALLHSWRCLTLPCSPGRSRSERSERHGRHAPSPSGLHGAKGEDLRVLCSVFASEVSGRAVTGVFSFTTRGIAAGKRHTRV